ncbi:MAG: pentapeptide repeat-containing protein [Anaerolineae bacterium]
MMNQDTAAKLRQYLNALRALQRSTERSVAQGMVDGTGDLAARGYRGLHAKVAELMPDDFFITESLKLELKPDEEDIKVLSQVQLATSQLVMYVEGLLKDSEAPRSGWAWNWQGDESGATFRPPTPPTPPGMPNMPNPPTPPNAPPPPDWRSLGRELQDQIINLTRTTIKRALSNIEVDVNAPNSMRGIDMEGETLAGRNFKQGRLFGANLRGVNGEGVIFEDARLAGVNFNEANLTHANFSRTRVDGCTFSHANLSEASLEAGVFVGCDFSQANLTGANLDKARLVNPNLTGATMPDGTAYDGGDLRKFGATLVTRRVHIEIDTDDDDNKPKRDDLQ